MNNISKKLFLIAATDKENSLNWNFTCAMRDLFNNSELFNESYTVQIHNELYQENLYESLDEAIRNDNFEGYIIYIGHHKIRARKGNL